LADQTISLSFDGSFALPDETDVADADTVPNLLEVLHGANPHGCTDNDNDGFYAEPGCEHGKALDCWDGDAAMKPGADGCIPRGTFRMGDVFGGGSVNELPGHSVTISSFQMDQYEVTVADYKNCVTLGGCSLPKYLGSSLRLSDDYWPNYTTYPVINIRWADANQYCKWRALNDSKGGGWRLPTEAEWEYAARGGLAGKRFPWSIDTTYCNQANYGRCDQSSFSECSCQGYEGYWGDDTATVGHYPSYKNGYGLYDMSGNVWEWVKDIGSATYYSECKNKGTVTDPQGPATGIVRVIRGGSWYSFWTWTTVSTRKFNDQTRYYYQNNDLGFRCARGGGPWRYPWP